MLGVHLDGLVDVHVLYHLCTLNSLLDQLYALIIILLDVWLDFELLFLLL